MFETNMDEYLDEEVEFLKQVFEVICKGWDREVLHPRFLVFLSIDSLHLVSIQSDTTSASRTTATTLPNIPESSPGQAKRACIVHICSTAACDHRSADGRRGRDRYWGNIGDGWRVQVGCVE